MGKEFFAGWRENRKQLLKGFEGKAKLKLDLEVCNRLDVGHKGGVMVRVEPREERK